MDDSKAQQYIVIATFITLASTIAGSQIHPKGSKPIRNIRHTVVGGFFAMLGCSIIAEVDPLAGVGLAVLVSGGAFLAYGLPSLETYYNQGKKK